MSAGIVKREHVPNEQFTPKQWEELVNETITSMAKLAATKGREYAGDSDRLANFRRNALGMDLSMEQVWRVYAGKHWDSIGQYIKDMAKGTLPKSSEPMSGRADDLIVYLLLFKAMLRERNIP